MKLESALTLDETRGSGSFDYLYWFWARRGSSFGIGYARQPIELDIKRIGTDAQDALKNIADVVSALDKRGEDQKSLGIIEKKIKSNTKRLQGIIDLFGSPIVVNWLSGIKPLQDKEAEEIAKPTGDKPSLVTVPLRREKDVVDLSGRTIDVVGLFRNPETNALAKTIDWTKVRINDKDGDTQNTIMAKFVAKVFRSGTVGKDVRSIARSSGIETIMKNLRFKDEKIGAELVPFKDADYRMFPEDVRGSRKMVSYLSELMRDKFKVILKRARLAF
jgi:hypothetical protein